MIYPLILISPILCTTICVVLIQQFNAFERNIRNERVREKQSKMWFDSHILSSDHPNPRFPKTMACKTLTKKNAQFSSLYFCRCYVCLCISFSSNFPPVEPNRKLDKNNNSNVVEKVDFELFCQLLWHNDNITIARLRAHCLHNHLQFVPIVKYHHFQSSTGWTDSPPLSLSLSLSTRNHVDYQQDSTVNTKKKRRIHNNTVLTLLEGKCSKHILWLSENCFANDGFVFGLLFEFQVADKYQRTIQKHFMFCLTIALSHSSTLSLSLHFSLSLSDLFSPFMFLALLIQTLSVQRTSIVVKNNPNRHNGHFRFNIETSGRRFCFLHR